MAVVRVAVVYVVVVLRTGRLDRRHQMLVGLGHIQLTPANGDAAPGRFQVAVFLAVQVPVHALLDQVHDEESDAHEEFGERNLFSG